MNNIKRRDLIKLLGAISFGIVIPSWSNETFGKPTLNKEKKRKQTLETDILVIGGGTAGIIAAIQAARAGCKTMIVENGSHLGGTITKGGVNFPGLFHAWGKQIIKGIGWELVKKTVALDDGTMPDFSKYPPDRHWHHQIRLNTYLYSLLAEEKCIESGVEIHYYETPVNIVFQDNKWLVETVGKGVNNKITCNQIIDCTGNGCATSLAGFHLIKESETQPGALIFQLGGYDYRSLDFQKIPKRYRNILRSGYFINNAESDEPFVPYNQISVNSANSTTSESHTNANIKGRTSLLQMLRTLRSLPGCEKTKILDMQPETAVRETYRIDGVYKITYSDYISGKVFDDSMSYSFYPIDLHREQEGILQEYLEQDIVATVPLRALIPKGSKNFVVAGRCVSSDRLANSALRVQASCMGMGQSAGAAAALASKYDRPPLEVPIGDLKELIEKHDGIVPV
ncbi:MAG: FAD-dependent oxidoreductase [Bacteroidales bacterium]|nr:FAD-dependent oxidoreductase [Bacteroidales bacterium]